MKILISSHSFLPQLGGIEQVSATLAQEFLALGHEVRVITCTPSTGSGAEHSRYTVYRNPSRQALFALVRWSDAYLQSNISLQTLWPALLLRKPTLVVYHTWLTRPDGRSAWQDRLKRAIVPHITRNLAVSTCLARSVAEDCGVISNPYDDQLFRRQPNIEPAEDLVFLGRLVSDKGLDGLFDALLTLQCRGLRPRLSIIGSGPEEQALRLRSEASGLKSQVSFLGTQRGPELVATLHAHRLLVVPSRWAEPFGLVVLEGLACGLQVIASHTGGLPEALGSCGSTFESGNWHQLADKIEHALAQPAVSGPQWAKTQAHLEKHKARAVALEYLRHLREITGLCHTESAIALGQG